ncbi:MAG: alpha-amylase family glycosyl hydrolase [Alloprevotella sp.]|nr:alpha-amylase family glycosyl hydrolase [Alloprevotella sp.]
MNTARKPIIYQLLPRLYTNFNDTCLPSGTIEQNGSGKMAYITPEVLRAIKELSVSHVWYTGVIEHAHCPDYTPWGIIRDNPHVVKGQAGSPYAISDYYDIDPDIAVDPAKRMEEFEALLTRTHDAGLNVIIDFVPNHVARRYASDAAPQGAPADFGSGDNTDMFFSPANNFYYITRQLFAPTDVDLGSGKEAYVEFPAKASGNDCFNAFPNHNDWYETVKLNYGVDPANGSHHFDPIPPTWHKMLHILFFWAGKGVDGFRCDMAHMVPLEFWQWAIGNVKAKYPHVIFIAELYDIALYRPFISVGGFDYLYDKSGLYDTLRAIQTGSVSAAALTSCWQQTEGIAPHMLNFLENHDEQRFASEQYAGDPAKAIPSLVVSSMMTTGPMMIYMGQEIGEPGADAEGYSGRDGRTTIFDYWSLSTLRRWLSADGPCHPGDAKLTPREKWLRGRYINILSIASSQKAITRGRFFDLMYVNYDNPSFNPHRHYAFLRSTPSETLLIVANFSADSADLRINLPTHAFEMLQLPDTPAPQQATELLAGRKESKVFCSSEPFHTFIPPYEAVVWRLSHRQGR